MLLQELTHYMLPILAMLFEVFVAFLQAGVFALLTLFYIKLATDELH
jgi:F0F1-type ATP synthase membrane subunit a